MSGVGPAAQAPGLRVGLEVHQQLDCGKLFCACTAVLSDEPRTGADFTRRLAPVASRWTTTTPCGKLLATNGAFRPAV